MLVWKRYNELTEMQKKHAKQQYAEIRATEDEITFEEAWSNYNVDDEECMYCCNGFEVDTKNEGYIFVDI